MAVKMRAHTAATQAAEAARGAVGRRGLGAAAADRFYAEVDRRVAERAARAVNKTSGRRLEGERSRVVEKFAHPPAHEREYGWVAAATDWREAVANVHAAASVIAKRNDYVLAHVDDRGHLPTGDLPDRFRTGFSALDLNVPPSAVGNVWRRLHAWATGMHRSDAARSAHSRRMDEARHAHAKGADGAGDQSLLGAVFGAASTGGDVLRAARGALQARSRGGALRRMADSFLGTAASLPIVLAPTSNKYVSYEQDDGHSADLFRAGVRYLVFSARTLPPGTPCDARVAHTTDPCLACPRHAAVLSVPPRLLFRGRLRRRHDDRDASHAESVLPNDCRRAQCNADVPQLLRPRAGL